MQIKTHPAMKVFYSTHRTTLETIHEHIGTVARNLYAEAAKQNILVTGPCYWFYFGADGNPKTEFTLEIVLPIATAPAQSSSFKHKELPKFKCLATTHHGSWNKLGDTYAQLFQHLQQQKLQPVGANREIYINIDFVHEENNITEVQIGLQ